MNGESTPAPYLLKLIDVLEKHGISAAPMLNKAGITAKELEDRESSVPIAKYLAFVEAVVLDSAIPDLGFLVGEHTSPLEHGVLGYALLSSPNLKESLVRYERYQNLPGPLLKVEFSHNEQQAYLIAEPVPGGWQLSPAAQRYFLQEWLVGWKQWAAIIDEHATFFQEVRLALPADGLEAVYEQHLGCPVSFDHGVTEALFPVEYLDKPLEYADSTIGGLCAKQFEHLLDALKLHRRLEAEIHCHLANSPGTIPSMVEMAEKLCMGVRTLRNRLQRENTTYQQIVIEFRMAMARRYLAETRLSANEVAELVGYADTASFYHAFRKVFGTTPQQFRFQSAAPL